MRSLLAFALALCFVQDAAADRWQTCPPVLFEKDSSAKWTTAAQSAVWILRKAESGPLSCWYFADKVMEGGSLVFAEPADKRVPGLPRGVVVRKGESMLAHRWNQAWRWWLFGDERKGFYASQPCLKHDAMGIDDECKTDKLYSLQPMLWWGYGTQDLEGMDLKTFAAWAQQAEPKRRLMEDEP